MYGMFGDASCAILAGGLGTRLGGTAKPFLEIQGRTILARQLDVLRPLFTELLVVAPRAEAFEALGLRTIADRYPGKGAPGGVHAALWAATTEWVFCLACDMPFICAAAIELLASRRAGARAVVPLRDGFPEPLFAFWAKGLEPSLAGALEAGEPSLAKLLEAAQATRVRQADLEAVDPGCRSLQNVNTPEDLRHARSVTGR
jgi:molybdopterin-guanine dinucleotide biosynthesis protein A